MESNRSSRLIASPRRFSRGLARRITGALLACAAATMFQTAVAAVIKVPTDQSTIQGAINAASAGDVIWVAQGTYKENLVLKAGVELEGGWKSDFSARNWTAWPAVVDGDGVDSVVVGASGATVDGFTLRNGDAARGGGIRLVKAQMTIRNNTIEDNVATQIGGGIYIEAHPSAPPYTDIESNIIRRNKTTTDVGGTGGGIHVTRSSQGIRITNNTIGGAAGDGNDAQIGGGGIYVDLTPVISIQGNTISHNQAVRMHGGGVMIIDGSPNATLADNLIEYNSANGNYGGGVYSIGGTFISSNRIGKNSLFNTPSAGGGLVVDSFTGTAPRIENNFLYGNMAEKGGGIYLHRGQNVVFMNNSVSANKPDQPNAGGGMYVASGATCILQNTILWGNGDDLYEADSGACTLLHNDIEDGDGQGSNGNISADPLFAAYDDLHVSASSPVINAGDSAAAPSLDIDGDTRDSKVDIGADEVPGENGGSICPLVKSAEASYLEPHVDAVRSFRDRQLRPHPAGRILIALYYEHAPAISAMLDAHPPMKTLVRITVTPVVLLIAYPLFGVLALALIAGVCVGLTRAHRR